MPTVFILDDDTNLLAALDIWLSGNGFKVHTFSYSGDLMSALNTSMPDIILLDVLLSELKDGKNVCTELKQQYQFPNKIFLFSATHIPNEELIKCEADGFIDKPFEIQQLLNTLNKSLQRNDR